MEEAVANNILTLQSAFSVITTLHLTSHLWPEQTPFEECPIKYDFIVVGAGSAGCVVAARLAEAKFKVLLIEAGDDPPIETIFPSLYVYLSSTYLDWNYKAENNDKTKQCHKSNMLLSRGKVIGGSGSINGNIYVRGTPHDFHLWAEAAKDDSWNYENVLPYFKKSEDLLDKEVLNSKYKVFHGTGGPMKITRQPHEEIKKYLEAFRELGHNIILDANGNETLGYNEPMYTIAGGHRQSSAYGFIASKICDPYLHVLKKTFTTKVLFDDFNKAIGVEAILENNKTVTIKASKEVIISAGVFNSPQILMLSGIGPKEHLKSLGIPVRSDLPVGENLQDQAGLLVFHTTDDAAVPAQPPTDFPGYMMVGYVALNKSQTYPDYQVFSFRIPDDETAVRAFCSIFFNMKENVCSQIIAASKNKTILFTVVVALHLKCRGKVLLRSTNPEDPPIVILGTFCEEEDVDTAATYIEDFIQVGNTTFFKSINATLIQPDIPGCEDIPKGTKEYWKCYARCLWVSEYHYAGTCALGSVTHPDLKVKGVEGLRVADSSVMHIVTSGNTNAPTVMIGEKAADMIIKEYSDC